MEVTDVGGSAGSSTLDLATAAAEAAAIADAHAVDSEQLRTLAPAVVDALIERGLLTLTLPVAYGGPGVTLVDLIDTLSTIGHGDGAAGWCAMIGITTTSLVAFTDEDVARHIFADPKTPTAGVFAPNGTARRVEDGWRVDGRWSWGSGSRHAEWITGGCRADDGTMRVCWFPAADVELHDTWHTIGLRGTGSGDFSVTDVLIPDGYAVQPGSPRVVDEPMAKFPNFTMLAVGVAAVAIGIARRGLDELIDLAGGKTPQYSSKSLAAAGFTQTELARAEARWRAAQAFLNQSAAAAWTKAAAGERVSVADRVDLRLAAAHAASECVAVANTAWTLAGGSAVSDTGVLGRCMRDSHMVTQHIMVAPKVFETLGKFYAGVEFNDSMI